MTSELFNLKPIELLQFFEENMKYGFVYRNKVFTDYESDFQQNMDKLYKIRLGNNFIKHRYGVCWDFCEFERLYFLANNIEYECYFIESCINNNDVGPTHTFAIYKQNNKWYWFEYSWLYHRGIWEYNSKDNALKDILNKFKKFYGNKLKNISIYKTNQVTKRLNAFEFVKHCLEGEKIKSI